MVIAKDDLFDYASICERDVLGLDYMEAYNKRDLYH
jgi:hypothetical protein